MAASSPLATVTFPNCRLPSPALLTGGAPDEAALRAAAAAGVRHVVDLRPTAEWTFDEPTLVAALGMRFVHLPIGGTHDLTIANVKAFDALLGELGGEPTLLHCASGNRVGALMALRAGWLKGASRDDALAVGREHGLTRMEPQIDALLSG